MQIEINRTVPNDDIKEGNYLMIRSRKLSGEKTRYSPIPAIVFTLLSFTYWMRGWVYLVYSTNNQIILAPHLAAIL